MIFSGGRLEGSKRNLKFESASCDIISNTFKVKIFFFFFVSCCFSFTALELFCHNYMKNP